MDLKTRKLETRFMKLGGQKHQSYKEKGKEMVWSDVNCGMVHKSSTHAHALSSSSSACKVVSSQWRLEYKMKTHNGVWLIPINVGNQMLPVCPNFLHT